MKTIFLECNMGAAGDMLTAALLELLPQPEALVEELNGLGIPGVVYSTEKVTRCGITGTRMRVAVQGQEEEALHGHSHEHSHEHHHEHPHEHLYAHSHEQTHIHGQEETHEAHHHAHSGMEDIARIVKTLQLPQKVEEDVMAVYGCIAEAESRVHGVSTAQIHFHEVGSMDAVADITAVCLLMHRLSPEQVIVSPIRVGSGTVRCAHGVLPVPAPATARLLTGMPVYAGDIPGEMCTPTGAALLKHFASDFGNMPLMRVEAVGYGMGAREFRCANCVRAFLGEG